MITTTQVLGIQFFNGNVDEAVQSMTRRGGFMIAPSGTCFARLREDETYRRALLAADLAIADSGLMVLLWRLLRGENIQRISGLKSCPGRYSLLIAVEVEYLPKIWRLTPVLQSKRNRLLHEK